MSEKKPVNKKTFDVTLEGQKRQLAVVRPTNVVSQKATLVHGRAYKEAMQAGLANRAMLEKILREAKLWDDVKQSEFESLSKKIRDAEMAVRAGGMKVPELREKALELRRLRAEQRQLLADRNREDGKTADAYADQARFNYLVSACTVDEQGKPFYSDTEDYLNREDDPVAMPAARLLGELLYDIDASWEKTLPENRALLAFKLCDQDLHLIDKQGRKVDAKGRLVNDEGRFVDEKGNFVDGDGNPLTADGEYKVEAKPFYDESGNPIPNPFADEPAEPATPAMVLPSESVLGAKPV
jgi:hypothetical protein